MWAVCMCGGEWEHRTTKALPELTGGSRCLQPPAPDLCPSVPWRPNSMGERGCLPTFGDAGELGLRDAKVVELQAIEGSRLKATIFQGVPAHL